MGSSLLHCVEFFRKLHAKTLSLRYYCSLVGGHDNIIWSKDVFILNYLHHHSTLQYTRSLQIEYEQLKEQHLRRGINPLASPPDSIVSPQHASEDAELIAEAKLLRQHKGRLEARMQILEDHNKQLESQLHRLRQLLEQVNVYSCLSFLAGDFCMMDFSVVQTCWNFTVDIFTVSLLCCTQSFLGWKGIFPALFWTTMNVRWAQNDYNAGVIMAT